MEYILIQLIGIIAWILLLFSYYKTKRKSIILIQICSSFLYVLHYYLLEAYSGVFTCTLSFIIGLLYYKTNSNKLIYLIILPILIAGAYYFYGGIFTIFPMIAAAIDYYALTKSKRFIVQLSIVTYILWVIYDIFVGSYSCMITDGILVLSNLSILLLNYNFLKEDLKQPIKAREELFK